MAGSELAVKEHRIEVEGGEIYAKTWSPALAPLEPCLLFHDSLGSVAQWRDFPEKLCQALGRRVLVYDRLGFGQSSLRRDVMNDDFINEEAQNIFPRLAEYFAFPRAHLFGHSVGGGMAVACAAWQPELCASLVAESAQAFVEDLTLSGVRDAEKKFRDPLQIEKLRKYHGERSEWVLRSWLETWQRPSRARWSLQNLLPKLQAPLLVLHGDQDEFASKKHPEMLERESAGPVRVHLLKDCGHVPHREKPAEVLAQVKSFYQSL